MVNHLKKSGQKHEMSAAFICDNQGVLKGCANETKHRLRHRRQASMDLYMEFWTHKAKSIYQVESAENLEHRTPCQILRRGTVLVRVPHSVQITAGTCYHTYHV